VTIYSVLFVTSLAIHSVMVHRHRSAGLHCMALTNGQGNAQQPSVPIQSVPYGQEKPEAPQNHPVYQEVLPQHAAPPYIQQQQQTYGPPALMGRQAMLVYQVPQQIPQQGYPPNHQMNPLSHAQMYSPLVQHPPHMYGQPPIQPQQHPLYSQPDVMNMASHAAQQNANQPTRSTIIPVPPEHQITSPVTPASAVPHGFEASVREPQAPQPS
jgi:hypothetical protein